jgi:hypothetical protein
VGGVLLAGLLERLFVGRPAGVDALVELGEVEEQGSADRLDLLDRRLAAVEGHGRRQVGDAYRQLVGHRAAEAEAHAGEAAGAGVVPL